jgi:glycosyltransferase involved in cell wall biosynthesis
VKLLVTVPSLEDPGGVAGYYRAVLPALRSTGVDVSPLEIGGTRNGMGFLHPVRDQLSLGAALRGQRYDVVQVNPSLDLKSFIRDGLFVRRALRTGARVVVFFHGWLASFEPVVEGRLWGFFQATYARAHSFIVLSSAFADTLRRWGVKAPIRVEATAIPNDFTDGFRPEEKLRGMAAGDPVRVLFLARLEKGKGIFDTLDAVKTLVERGADIRLDIAGDGSAREGVTRRLREDKSLSGKARFLGYVRGAEKREVLASSHVYCLPSETEGMPVSVLEAMAYGLVVVTRLVGGLKDFFIEESMGRAIPSPDQGSLATVLESLIKDREAMIRMSKFNAAYIKSRYLASHSASMLGETYREALGMSPPSSKA